MVCPRCGVEYRPGFTHCADCDTDLVQELPLARRDSFEPRQGAPVGDYDEDPFCSFWQGDDPRLHAELGSLLDEAGIPHKTVRRQDHLFNLNNYPAFQIGVPFSLYDKAEAVVKDAYGMDASVVDAAQSLSPPLPSFERSNAIKKLPEMLTPSEEENIPGPPDAGEDSEFDLNDAEVEVWFGPDESLEEMLIASLRENKIEVQRKDSGGKYSLLVSSRDEAQAREIVKEVVQGEPPK